MDLETTRSGFLEWLEHLDFPWFLVTDQSKQPSQRYLYDAIINCSPLRSISYSPMHKISRTKRGLASFVNGARLSVLADTGATQNVISAEYVKERKMDIEGAAHSFKLGNSRVVKSIGTVLVDYAFAEDPSKLYKLKCHVLPHCVYDLILGSAFLMASETLSVHRHRLTECLFSVVNVFHFDFLDTGCQLLEGRLANQYTIHALLDTGAERNVMDLKYIA